MNGSEILVQCLLEQEVDTVFGFPGGAVLNIYDALYHAQGQLTHILTCHEQAAAHAADGYARATGKPGVVIATSGPGATNLVTGIATAHMDSVPLVAITGNVASPLLGKDSFQEVDITGITAPVTKHNFIVRRVEDLADTVRSAFRIAQSGRPGPVLVDIPKDITAAECAYTPCAPQQPEPPVPPDAQKLEEAAALLAASERPMIFAGGGVVAANACGQLAALAHRLGAPVALSLMGLGAFPPSDPLCTGMLGMHGTRASAQALAQCDLLLALGTRFSDRVLCSPTQFAPHAKLVHLDVDPAEINKNIPASLGVVGDLSLSLDMLLEALGERSRPAWFTPPAGGAPTRGMPAELFRTLHRLTRGDITITTEVGQHQMWAAQYFPFDKPRRLLTSGGLGTMGYGLGAAIGAQCARPGQKVVNIAGDGSFYMNMPELATLATYRLPIVELVMNNGVLGMVRQWQKLFYDKRFSFTTLERKTDLSCLASAFGIRSFVIAGPQDIAPVLEQALACDGPCLVDCRIGPDENVLPMVPAGAPPTEQIFEIG